MSRSSHLSLVSAPDGARGAAWLATLESDYPAAELDLLRRVVEWLNPRLHGENVKGGESALDHGLSVATILRELKLDAESVAASLLVPVASNHQALVEVRDRFGASI